MNTFFLWFSGFWFALALDRIMSRRLQSASIYMIVAALQLFIALSNQQ